MSGQPPRVGVVGAGTLGMTVARAALLAGSPVTLHVRGPEERRRRRAGELATAVRRDAERAGRPPERAADGLVVTGDLADLAGTVDVVVESVPESRPLKQEVLAEIEDVVADDVPLASTTSSIPAAVLAARARRPERIVVAHYVWPAHRMPLVEVALHDATAPEALARLEAMLAGQGKRPVRVADRPGFLITRALFAYWDAALELVIDGCPPARVDEALTAFGWPMGPFTVMQATGLPSIAVIHGDLAPALDFPFPSLAALSTGVAGGARRILDERGGLDPELGAQLRRGDAARAAGSEEIVDRTVGRLAAEVDQAVAEGVTASWEVAGAAIDSAYGFPRSQGGLARWWQEARRTGRAPAPASVPAPQAPVVLEGHRERTSVS